MKHPSAPRLRGLVAAPYTPFHSDGSLALEPIPAQARSLARNGVRAAFICGTTGEGVSLTTAERLQVADAWCRSAPRGLAVIVHVGHSSAAEARTLARHAAQAGATACAAIAPSFFKPRNAAALAGWCAEVASAAPELPFYYYHMPAMTGVTIPAADFLAAVDGLIPNLAGVKFTHENLMDFTLAGAFGGGKYDLLFGRDEILLAGLSLGAQGAVGSTYNFAAPLYQRIIKAAAAGNFAAARRDQLKSMEFIAVLGRYGGLTAGKAVMKLIGLDCGPVRAPLATLSAAETKQLQADLKKIGFFSYASRV